MGFSQINRLRGSAGLTAIAFALMPGIVLAQDQNADDGVSSGGLDAIVVTARRVTEDLQDVPLSVAALDSETLQSRGIASITDMKSAVPNLVVIKTSVPGGNIIQMRGLASSNVPNVSIDSAVALYVDGVYLARPQSSGGEIVDISRIEALRGPQGTLSGRSALSGAVNFVTAEPTGEWGAIVEGVAGNQGRVRGRATINTGTYGGFSARVTYVHDETRGTIPNRAAGITYNWGDFHGSYTAAKRALANNIDGLMVKIRYESDNFTATYKFDRTDQTETYAGVGATGFPTTQLGQAGAGLSLIQAPGTNILYRGRPKTINQETFAPADIETWGHLLTAELSLSDALSIKSITAYREVEAFASSDVDSLRLISSAPGIGEFELCLSCSVLGTTQEQFSQELQLIGTNDRFDYILGALYFREKGYSELAFMNGKALIPGPDGVIPLTPADFFVGNKERATNTSYALYGKADVKLTDSLELAVGLRYTIDDRLSFDDRPAVPLRGFVNYKRLNYDVALTYEINSDIRVFARHATGYVSGGIVKQIVFKPQDGKSYEVGLKSELFDRKVRFNLTGFYMDVNDLQQTSFDPTVGLAVTNFSSAKIKGVEAEFLANPIEGLTIGTNVGYIDVKNPPTDIPISPEFTLAFNAQFDAPQFDNGSYLSFRIDGDYRSKYYGYTGQATVAQRSADPAFPLPPVIYADFPNVQAYVDDQIQGNRPGGYWLVNARASLMDFPLGEGATARLSGFVRNLFDEEGINYSVTSTFFQTSYERARTYGVEFGLNF